MRNPKLAKLKARMTAAAFQKRAEQMTQKSTWRGEMEVNHAKMFGTLNGLGQWLMKKDKVQQRYNYGVIALAVGVIGLLVGQITGWW